MSEASQNQSSLNTPPARGASTSFGPSSNSSSNPGTSSMSAGTATAAGHGPHPTNDRDDSNATLPNSRIGPQNEDLDGEQMRAAGEGEVFRKQIDKKEEGWGEEGSFTKGLEGMKEEQAGRREEVKRAREEGNVGGAEGRSDREGVRDV